MEGQKKYPKNIIERFDVFEKKFSIEEMNISAFNDGEYSGELWIKVVGEILGDKLPCDIIIAITIHNDLGEVIGAEFSTNIRADSFEGIVTFSESIRVAANEDINKIRVYPIKDPSVC